jgi:hypothetical protein
MLIYVRNIRDFAQPTYNAHFRRGNLRDFGQIHHDSTTTLEYERRLGINPYPLKASAIGLQARHVYLD